MQGCSVVPSPHTLAGGLQLTGIVGVGMSLPVANAKFVPKKKPEAAALFNPYFRTPFTAAWYLSQAAFSLAKARTCSIPTHSQGQPAGSPGEPLGTCALYTTFLFVHCLATVLAREWDKPAMLTHNP